MKNRKSVLVMAMVGLAIVSNAWGLEDFGPKYWSPTNEVVTPHITWDKPSAQGPLKVLFIVRRAGMREVVELAQRMDLQWTVFPVGHESLSSNAGVFCPPPSYTPDTISDRDALTDKLNAQLEKSYDIIALGNVRWDSFPLIIRYKLLKKVQEGAVLFGSVVAPDDYFRRATAVKAKFDLPALVPYKGLPAFARYGDAAAWLNATVDYAVFGKGKILTLKGFPIPEGLQLFTPGPTGSLLEPKLVEYDYYLAWIGHLMEFAAGRQPVRVTGRDCVTAERGNPGAVEYSVSGPAGKKVTGEFKFRNDANKVIAGREKKIILGSAGTAVRFDLPRAPAGRYFADLRVKEGKKIWAYGSSFVVLTGDAAMETIVLQKDYRRGENVTGIVRITAQKETVEGLELVLRQKDTYGRVTARVRIAVPPVQADAAREISFELSGGQPLTIIQYLEAELRKGNEILERKEESFSISDLPPGDDIRLIGWCSGHPSYTGYYMFPELAKAGFDTQYAGSPEICSLANIRHMPYVVHFEDGPRDKDDHVRRPCLTDPGTRKQLGEYLTKEAEKEKSFSVTEFSMGDEDRFVSGRYEYCFSPTCVAAFHRFLVEEYGTVEAMNREYNTRYTSFDEVRPVTLEEARKQKLEPLWVDFRRHMESTWAGIFLYCTETIRKIVPDAKVGYEGSDCYVTSSSAADYYKLMKVMRLNNTYDGAFVPAAVTAFSAPGTITGAGWYGGYGGGRCPEFMRYIAWRYLFRGANSYWVWTSDACEIGSIMAPDLSLYDFFKVHAADVREIKNGIGKLLMTAKRSKGGVAILYSASSVHVSTLTEGLPAMERVLNALVPMFEDANRPFGIISYEQVAEGALKQGGYKVLWMPYVQALSRKEAGEVEAFVREGGTVIADLRPGVRDEHGKPYEGGGILDKVFGVNQRTDAPLAKISDVKIGLDGFRKTLKNLESDWSLSLGSGEARALLGQGASFEKPALIINRYGKGNAILLNFSLSAYAGVTGALETSAVKISEEAGAIRELFNAVLARSGVEEPVKVSPAMPGVRLYRFGGDGGEYWGVLQELPDSPADYEAGKAKPLVATSAVLKLNGKKHVYDVRRGAYVGYTDRIKTAIEPSKGQLFALLTYKVEGIKLNAPRQVKRGAVMEYEAAIEGVKQPGLHVFHVEFISPTGAPVSYYAENMVGENGKGKGTVTLALNEAAGNWKIRVRDTATGMVVERTFIVTK